MAAMIEDVERIPAAALILVSSLSPPATESCMSTTSPSFRRPSVLPLVSALIGVLAAMVPAAEQTFPVRLGTPIGAATLTDDKDASAGATMRLEQLDQGVSFAKVPQGKKLAIRSAAVDAGTLSVLVNGKPACRVYVHSSGSLTGSFVRAVVDVDIPAGATLTIARLNGDPLLVDPDKSQWYIDGKWGTWQGDVRAAIDNITVGDDLKFPTDIWNLPKLVPAPGPYTADWQGLSKKYVAPNWWREAKLGAWVCWNPQVIAEAGEWYARPMYEQGSKQYEYHVKNFGHPSEFGYKDLCHQWSIDKWKPEALMDLFVEMGAKYFMAMGNHHDNYDCWDSTYQPWNSVRVGPKQDIVGKWQEVAHAKGMRFGIGFHITPGRTWGQFMQVRYQSDKTGPKAGVPYDAMKTILDGKGTWWEGMDPVDLYGYPHRGSETMHSPFSNQFMWRIDDAITKYRPDIIYFDDHAGDSQVDLNIRMGLGFLSPPLVANYYNKSLGWNDGKMDVVINLKGVGGHYNSFQNTPELLPLVDRSLVKSTEAKIEKEIMAYSFQTESSIQKTGFHYIRGVGFRDARWAIGSLIENVCRNGTMLLNFPVHANGAMDAELATICKDMGAWLKLNGEAIYGSRPFEIYGENQARYTRREGKVYATLLGWDGKKIVLPGLRPGGATLGKVQAVELVGQSLPLTFTQDDKGLTVTAAAVPLPPQPGISDGKLANEIRVLRITHDRPWVNDDDPGTAGPGWQRICNLGTGDFNNDLTTSETVGDTFTYTTNGANVTVICPKEKGMGKIEVLVDGKSQGLFDLATDGPRMPQQRICTISDLPSGPDHVLTVINRGGRVAVDAFVLE